MQVPYSPPVALLAIAWAALYAPRVDAQQVGVRSRVFGPPPTRTIVGGTFTAGPGGFHGHGYGVGPGLVGDYGYRPYPAGYGAWYGGPWYRPPYFGYGYY